MVYIHLREGPNYTSAFRYGLATSLGGGGGYSTKLMFIWGGSVLRSELLTLLYTTFHEKGSPFVYPLLPNVTPFTYLV